MMRPVSDSPALARGRQIIDGARQRPLLTALVLTLMLAALFGAYALASRQGERASTPEPVGSEQPATQGDDGFLADGYAELEADDGVRSSSDWWGDVPGLLLRLLIVLGLAYGSLRLLNYFTRSGRLGGAHGRALEVVDHLNLGQNRSIYLVRVAGRVLVVGATSNQLNLLSRMKTDDLPEDVRSTAPNFTSQLHARVLRQLGGAPDDEDDQLEKRRQALRELRDEEAVRS